MKQKRNLMNLVDHVAEGSLHHAGATIFVDARAAVLFRAVPICLQRQGSRRVQGENVAEVRDPRVLADLCEMRDPVGVEGTSDPKQSCVPSSICQSRNVFLGVMQTQTFET